MQVFVTARAEKNFDSIVDHIKDKWGDKTAKEFIQKVDEIFKLLKAYPLMGQVENNDIRGFQLSRQTRVLYRIRENKIIILAFFDVRQDPNKKLS
ncbi:MAG TPA: type II toxin-antitoxin system RelE/ParE family toxin [Cyclobacteriaceae bacterium]|nr:type II toxin-antitoxin system RelE/ParE family toxin [Cyclobacteriaceae bacterium]